jgi:hypothetical protein
MANQHAARKVVRRVIVAPRLSGGTSAGLGTSRRLPSRKKVKKNCAADLNPDEHVWCFLKNSFRSAPITKDEHLNERVEGSMAAIAADRHLVRSFFGHPAVRYVKDALRW